MKRLFGFVCVAWMSTLPGCRIEVTSLHAGSGDRVGNATFSVELPHDGDWTSTCTEGAIRLERQDLTGFGSLIGKTVIEIRAHPLPSAPERCSEEEMAREFLAAETERSLGWGPEFVSSLTVDKDKRNGAKPLYGIGYSASSPKPRDNAIWGHDVAEVRREVYAYFPHGSSGPAFYSFDVVVARTSGWTIEWDSLRLIDGVIDSFQLKSVPPQPVPPSEVNP